MAKKVRKPRAASPRSYSQTGPTSIPNQPSAAPLSVSKAGTPTARTVAPIKAGQPVDLPSEYRYVGKDLKRLFTVAAVMLLLLVVANLAFTFLT